MNIHIVTHALPPQLDGIGDYTGHLAAELARAATVKVLTVAGAAHTPIPGVTIAPCFTVEDPRSVRALADYIRQDRPDWLLLQYQPFSYGRWGLNLHLPMVMRRITRCFGTKLALMVHEPTVTVESGRTADILFFSIDAWARRFRGWFPDKPVRHLPAGSNLPLVPTTRWESRPRRKPSHWRYPGKCCKIDTAIVPNSMRKPVFHGRCHCY